MITGFPKSGRGNLKREPERLAQEGLGLLLLASKMEGRGHESRKMDDHKMEKAKKQIHRAPERMLTTDTLILTQ